VETGKHYNNFRDYDPAIGRYIESDPLGILATWRSSKRLNHLYQYVDSRPLASTDALGLAGFVIGYDVNAFGVDLGAGGGSAPVFDPANWNVCYQAKQCTRVGLGLAFTRSLNGGLDTGPVCSGTSVSAGLFGTGGFGLAGIGSFRIGGSGQGGSASGNLGFGGGWGVAGGGEVCITTRVCLKDPPCCKCGNCGSGPLDQISVYRHHEHAQRE
jgi:RHS repeat-associated protein